MKTIIFLFTSALTAAGATVVLTGTPVPYPTSFSIPIPKSTSDSINGSNGGAEYPVKLNLIDLKETGLPGVVNQAPALNTTSAPEILHSTNTPAKPVDLESLWSNSSLQQLLEKSADAAQSGMNLTQPLPPATRNELVRIEPEPAGLVAAEPVTTTYDLLEPEKVEPIAKPLQNMIEEVASTIPAAPAINNNQQGLATQQNPLRKTQQKMIAAGESLASRFDNLVTDLTRKNPLKNGVANKQTNAQQPNNKNSYNALASIPNVESNKKIDQPVTLAQQPDKVPEPVAEVKSSKPATTAKPQPENIKPNSSISPPVQATSAPKKIAYVTWKKGYLSTDKRQLEYQFSGNGKTPVLITGSLTGRDYRNPQLMDRILYRLTSNEQLDNVAKYLVVRSPNPDGFAYGLPGNIRGVDLTKNFLLPQNQIVGLKSQQDSPTMSDDKLEIETRIYMHMLREFKPELVVQIRLHPEKSVPTIEYPSRLQSRITPYLKRNSLQGMEIVQPVAGSIEYYIKTVNGADYLTIHIPDHGNVDQDWLNNRTWFTELLNLCVAQDQIKNELVAAEPVKSGPQAQDEMVSYGSVTPLSPPDPTKLQGEVEFLPPPPGKANKLNSVSVDQGYVELPPAPKKSK